MISHLGRYEIIGELGQGAMGIVYKAKDPLIDRTLAIKTISLNLAMDEREEYEQRFYQEAKAAGRLSHPNIVTVYDVGKSGDVAYIAMEFLQGRELRDALNEELLMPVSKVVDIVRQIAQGLAYAHEHGIVHRDVKPSNIMMIRDGHVKITDFGIARMASSTLQTQTGVVLGSPKYMSPEQVLGNSIDQRSDIFSLGVMLYEMLTGQAPFSGDSINAVMYQTLNSPPPLPSTINLDVPAMLNFIVSKALAKELDDRYQNASEFADDLLACRDKLPRTSEKIIEQTRPPSSSASANMADAIAVAGKPNIDTDEGSPVAPMKLSSDFDSFEATMRMVALTSPDDLEEIGKTLKIKRPSLGAINQTAPPKAKPAEHITARTIPLKINPADTDSSSNSALDGKLFLIIVVLLVLLGLVIFL